MNLFKFKYWVFTYYSHIWVHLKMLNVSKCLVSFLYMAPKQNMWTMCHKVIVSLLSFTLNSADFYIYCVRISRFNAWPIWAPAYISPCGTLLVVLQVFVIDAGFKRFFPPFNIWTYMLNPLYINICVLEVNSTAHLSSCWHLFHSVCWCLCLWARAGCWQGPHDTMCTAVHGSRSDYITIHCDMMHIVIYSI